MKITCFGEVLWDIFPEHKKIGGAPLNVALRLHTMEIQSSLITKTGNDLLGKEILTYVKERGLPLHTFQVDHKYNTGEVIVTLDEYGTASYEISAPVAWDFIEYTEEAKKEVKDSDAIIFGTLASRNKDSRTTLLQLVQDAKYKILDVNLRPPHCNTSLLSQLMIEADFIKLNDEELDEICHHFSIEENLLENQIKAISEYTNTRTICVTKGGKGATLYKNKEFYHNNGYKVKVIDTVGAGDSFLATLIAELLQNNDPQESLDKACAIGAMVAGSAGANPVFTNQEIFEFIADQSKSGE